LDLLIELVTILLTSFGLNLIPFASPSNLLIASNAAVIGTADPFSIGLLVAVGSASAKFIHYIVTFFIGGHIGEKRRKRLDAVAPKLRRSGPIALFIAAATPIPDEPVIIPLGLLKYSPAKFLLAYFAGKLTITVAGAFFGKLSEDLMASIFTQEAFIVISIVLTLIVTVVLLKVDVGKMTQKLLKKKAKTEKQ
jgi:membrane protein DedA with SNARE-associated domain